MNEEHEDAYAATIQEDVAATEAVVRAVAAVSNKPVLELPPLAEAIDPDTLDQLFSSSTPPVSLEFEYDGYLVALDAETVRILERE